MPICNKCGLEKEQDQFPRDKKSKTGYSYRCKKCNYAHVKEYNKLHEDQVKSYQMAYRKDHVEKTKEYNQNYYSENKDDLAKNNKIYRENNKVVISNWHHAYYIENKSRIQQYKKEWSCKNEDHLKEKRHRYYTQNKEHIMKQGAVYSMYRRQNDVEYRILCNLRRRITYAIQDATKLDHTLNLVGCTIGELKIWLESQFTDGMTWDNYGIHGWHIDHIRPCSSFDLTKLEQQMECFHYTNLQPLWAIDNLRKSDKWKEEKEA